MALHQIYISVGSNVDRDKHTRGGINALKAYFPDIELSRVYESEAVGFKGSHFYNLVVGAKTDLSVAEVCRVLKQIETEHGRVRGEKKFSPRTLDLDLLLYDDLITDDGVEIPRGEICTNAFVLQPLAEIAPHVVHPKTGQTIDVMWQNYDKTSQQLWPIDFQWSE